MTDFLTFVTWLAGVGYLLWAVAAISRSINRHYEQPGEER